MNQLRLLLIFGILLFLTITSYSNPAFLNSEIKPVLCGTLKNTNEEICLSAAQFNNQILKFIEISSSRQNNKYLVISETTNQLSEEKSETSYQLLKMEETESRLNVTEIRIIKEKLLGQIWTQYFIGKTPNGEAIESNEILPITNQRNGF